jgi:predicted dehydrogenase
MSRIRVGIVGAGANTKLRHIPGLRALPDVELAGVVNRTSASTQKSAQEHGIERTYADWQALVNDDELDAVLIGTWPDMHCEITCAALKAGKHVLTEARMARSLDEARMMLEAALAQPDLVTQIVPSPFGLEHHAHVQRLLQDGFLGDLRELVVVGVDASFYDAHAPLHWRQDAGISGVNVLTLGIMHETALRWVPAPNRVFAQTAVFESLRPAADGSGPVAATVPDSVQILTQMPGGSRGLYHMSGVNLHGPTRQIQLYGSRGTIKLLFSDREELYVGQAGDDTLRRVELEPEQRGGWRVEAEFIGAIRGEEQVRFTDFPTGVSYMEFTEAVARSAQENRSLSLPLPDAAG